MHGPDILNLECLDVKVVQSQQSDGIVHLEAKGKRLDKVLALLQRPRVDGVLRRAQLHRLALNVHPALQLEVLDEWRVDGRPRLLEGCHSVRRDGDLASFHSSHGVLQNS